MQTFFFITNYDETSSSLIYYLLNSHPDIHCSNSKSCDLLSSGQQMTNTLDEWIQLNSSSKKINGNVNQFPAYELQNKILAEKTRHPLRMAHLAISPYLRVKLIMHTWIATYKTPELALENIQKQFQDLLAEDHVLNRKYRFHDIYQQIQAMAVQEPGYVTLPEHTLFIFALAKMITQDSADLPSASKKFLLENLLVDEMYFQNFVKYLFPYGIKITPDWQEKLKKSMQQCHDYLTSIQNEPTQPWMLNLITKFMTLRLKTIYYPHVDKPLLSFYKNTGYTFPVETENHPYSKLISIQLNSNRPAQLSIYFDNIEETTDHLRLIEVVVNIDDDDSAMQEMLDREIQQRPFTIKYIKTPRPKSFCDLWEPINKLLAITDPGAYFLLNISDEMLFATKGWDTILKKYVGYFPDHIFRLRASRNQFRNYFDRWECSFGQDSIPITTKKWIEIGGDWNPCFGPDSFQQLISFYLAKEGQFSSSNYLRELPIIDIKFHGDIPALGINPLKVWKLDRDHVFAMQICQSYKMQLEARRRAILLKSHMLAASKQIKDFEIVDDKVKKNITLVDTHTGQIIATMDYKVSWIAITFTNQLRKLRFHAYFGAGKEYEKGFVIGFASYLKSKYAFFQQLYLFLKNIRKKLKTSTN